MVLLSGEAGIGKSRLVRGAVPSAWGSTGVPRLTLHCSPYHTNSAFYPVIDHLQRLLHWHRDVSPEARLSHPGAGDYRRRACPWRRWYHCWPLYWQCPLPERYPPLTLSPQRQKQQTQETLVAWLLAGHSAAAGAGRVGRPALGRPVHAGAARPAPGPGSYRPPAAGVDRAPGVSPAVGPAGAPDAAHPHPPDTPTGGGDGPAGDGGHSPCRPRWCSRS